MATTWEDRAKQALESGEAVLGECEGFHWVLVYQLGVALTCALLAIRNAINQHASAGEN